MRRTARPRPRRSSSRGRLILFLAGGIVTACLLVVVLISLEQHAPVQSALPEKPDGPAPTPTSVEGAEGGDPPPVSGTRESPSAAPERFTFYETLPQLNKQDPGFVDRSSETKRPSASTPDSAPAAAIVSPGKPPIRYTVQVAAVADRSTAEALAARLNRKGYPAFVLPHIVPKRGAWYRVRVGHFTDRQTAQELSERLSRQERLTTYIAKE